MTITVRERLSYAVGDLGFNLVWQSIELYLLFFYIEVMELPLGIAAFIFLIGALADWIIDPTVGSIVDRFSEHIPMRRWVAISGPLLGPSLWLAFYMPPLEVAGLTVYAAATHILLRFAYAAGNIPYAALTARMTDDPTEQIRLTGLRMQGAATGGIVAAGIYAITTGSGDVEKTAFLTGALILGLLAQPCLIITSLGVRERIHTPAKRALALTGELRAYFMLVAGSASIRRLLATIVLAGLSTTVTAKSILFFFDRDLSAGGLGYWAALLPSIALLTTTPIWVALSKKWGLVNILIFAAVAHNAALIMLGLSTDAGVKVSTAWLAMAVSASCGMSVIFWSLVPTAIRELESRPDAESCAARVYAVSNTSRKLGQALAPQFIALSLWWTGGGDASTKSGSVVPALIVAAILCSITVSLYRPNARSRLATAG